GRVSSAPDRAPRRDGRGSALRNALSLENKGLPGRRRAPRDVIRAAACQSTCQGAPRPHDYRRRSWTDDPGPGGGGSRNRGRGTSISNFWEVLGRSGAFRFFYGGPP